MNSSLFSLLVYAIPANLLAATIMFAGRNRAQWHALEYLFIYLPWLMAMALVIFLFGSLDAGLEQSGLATTMLKVFSVAGGLLGGISLLPRVFAKSSNKHRLLFMTLCASLTSLLFVKFILLISLLMQSSKELI